MTEPDRTHSTPPTECAGLAAPATTDPITLGVIWGALQSIAVEIGTTVHKTAYSEQAREGQDFSVAVFDPQGRMVAQGPYSPGHMGAMSFAVKNALAAHPVKTLRPGDAILLNDPLLGSGHLPDFFVTQPAFHQGELVGQRTADNDRGTLARILHPVCSQTGPQSEQRFAGVLVEFESGGKPAGVPLMALMLSIEEPLQRERLDRLRRPAGTRPQ